MFTTLLKLRTTNKQPNASKHANNSQWFPCFLRGLVRKNPAVLTTWKSVCEAFVLSIQLRPRKVAMRSFTFFVNMLLTKYGLHTAKYDHRPEKEKKRKRPTKTHTIRAKRSKYGFRPNKHGHTAFQVLAWVFSKTLLTNWERDLSLKTTERAEKKTSELAQLPSSDPGIQSVRSSFSAQVVPNHGETQQGGTAQALVWEPKLCFLQRPTSKTTYKLTFQVDGPRKVQPLDLPLTRMVSQNVYGAGSQEVRRPKSMAVSHTWVPKTEPW